MPVSKDPKLQGWIDSYGSWFSDEKALELTDMGNSLHPYDAMFSPVTINKVTVKNRLVMGPMGNISMCDETGRPNDKMLQYFFERAKGGVGLITTGLVPVSHKQDNTITELGDLSYFPRIDRSRTVYMGWRDLAQGVHVYGAKIFVQLTPGLGRVGNPQCLLTKFKLPQSASMNPNFYMPQVPSVPMSGAKLGAIVKNMGQGAADSKAFGLDGAYLHGHEGYLLEQMTNPAYNRRKFGRYSHWPQFGLDCVAEMRKRTGPDYPIMYRIDLSLCLNETYGDEMLKTSLKKFSNGRTIDQTLSYMEDLVKAGVDIFDVDLGSYDNWWLPHPPSSMPPGCFLEVSKIVKDHFASKKIKSNAGLEVPIVAVGKLGYPDLAEKALRDGKCDMVMLARPLLADPEWPKKAYVGKTGDITPCIGCQEGCVNEFVEGGHPQCAVNPRSAFEHMYPLEVPKALVKKKVAVIGAGPGGITFALTALKRGHDVTLFEKSNKIGGRLNAGSVPKIKYELGNYLAFLERELKKSDVVLKLGESLDSEALKAKGFDAVIFAIGTKETVPALPGIEEANAVLATDLFLNPSLAKDAKTAVVVGGGMVGCEAAYWLKYEKGLDVKVVEMDKHIMNHVCTANRGHIIHYLKEAGVELLNCTKVSGFGKGIVKVKKNVSPTVPNPYVTWHPILPENIHNPMEPKLLEDIKDVELSADLVVIAVGGKPDQALFFDAQKKRVAPEVYNIGDSLAPGMVLQATRAAYRLAMDV